MTYVNVQARSYALLVATTLFCSSMQTSCLRSSEVRSQLRDEKAEIPAAAVNAYEYARIQALRANLVLSLTLARLQNEEPEILAGVLTAVFKKNEWVAAVKDSFDKAGLLSRKTLGSDLTKGEENQAFALGLLILVVAIDAAIFDEPAIYRAITAPQALRKAFRRHGWRIYRILGRGLLRVSNSQSLTLGSSSVVSIGISGASFNFLRETGLIKDGYLTKKVLTNESEIKGRFSDWAKGIVEEFAPVYRSKATPWDAAARARFQNAIEAELARSIAAGKARVSKDLDRKDYARGFPLKEGESVRSSRTVDIKDFDLLKVIETGKFLTVEQLHNLKAQRLLWQSFERIPGNPLLSQESLDAQANLLVRFLATELELLGVLRKADVQSKAYDLPAAARMLGAAQKRLARMFKIAMPEKGLNR